MNKDTALCTIIKYKEFVIAERIDEAKNDFTIEIIDHQITIGNLIFPKMYLQDHIKFRNEFF